MRALVTGGAGFIGSNLVEALLGAGADVRVLDDFSSGRRSNLAAVPEWAARGGGRYELLEGDIRDAATCRDAAADRTHVFHLAAIPSVARSVADPLGANAVNVGGTLQVLLAAREAGAARVVFASSAAIYGSGPELPKVETMAAAPASPYGIDKFAGETYARLFFELYGLPTVALRFFNVFGPRQDPRSEYAAVVPRFVEAALARRPATIYGDGLQTRDFIYVGNIVAALRAAAAAPLSACGRSYNVACGTRTSLLELVEVIGALVGGAVPPRHEPGRAGDIPHSVAGIDLAAAHLGFRAAIPLREGLRATIDDLRRTASGI